MKTVYYSFAFYTIKHIEVCEHGEEKSVHPTFSTLQRIGTALPLIADILRLVQ